MLHGNVAIFGNIHLEPCLAENRQSDLTAYRIVLDQQQTTPSELPCQHLFCTLSRSI